MTLHLYDGMNVIRRMMEAEVSGRPVRKLFIDMHALPAADLAVFVWDGPGAKAKRQSIYPRYKSLRKPQPDMIWKTIELVRELLRDTRALQITVPEYEADDVIAHYAAAATAAMPALIHSTDRDFNALLTNPNVKGTFNPIKGVPPEWVRLYKTCVGDASDNISGVKSFGDKTWELVRARGELSLLQQIILRQAPVTSCSALAPRVQKWITENPGEIAAMWQIVGFLPMSADLSHYTTVGAPNFDKGNARLEEFML